VRFSPFYPLRNIPVPKSEVVYSASVEGIWQVLKVFENNDIDVSKFRIKNMKGLKRTVRKFGNPLGHRFGVAGEELLDYVTARRKIYVPAYQWVLKNKLKAEVDELLTYIKKNDIVLLDYQTNDKIDDASKPFLHASLIRSFLLKGGFKAY